MAVTVKQMKKILEQLEQDGKGEFELAFGYDGGHGYTTTDGKYDADDDQCDTPTVWFKDSLRMYG